MVADRAVPALGLQNGGLPGWLHQHPVDALIDFSVPQALRHSGEEHNNRRRMRIRAISNYDPAQLAYARSLGECTPTMCSANITLGVNCPTMAAKLLRQIARFAEVEVLEQHFKAKP